MPSTVGRFAAGNRLLDPERRTVQARSGRSNSLTSGHRACQGCGEALGARYVLDAGSRGDLLDLHVALAPCLIGYAEIATWLDAQPFVVRDGNPYAGWIAMYASEEFQAAAAGERAWLNEHLANVTPRRFAELATIFKDATRLEIDFWQMGLDRRL